MGDKVVTVSDGQEGSRCHIALYTKHSHAVSTAAASTGNRALYCNPYRAFFIILSRPGPTPIHSIGTFRYSSMNVTYFLQFSGNSPYDDTAPIDVFQPGKVTYDTSATFSFSRSATTKPDEHNSKASPSGPTGKTNEFLSINDVFHGDLDLLKVIENVKLCQVKRIVAIDLRRMLHDDKIEPPATSPTAGGGAKLAPNLLEMDTHLLLRTITYQYTHIVHHDMSHAH